MMETQTLADIFAQIGEDPGRTKFVCTVDNPVTGKRCGYKGYAFEFAAVGDIPIVDRDYICGGCWSDLRMQADSIGRLMTALFVPAGWDSEEGNAARAKRNFMIDEARKWADPLTSPYTEECQAAWAQRIQMLNRITVDYERPGLVDWGVEPDKVFA